VAIQKRSSFGKFFSLFMQKNRSFWVEYGKIKILNKNTRFEIMFEFNDMYNNKVLLTFDDQPYSKSPKHVWVICRYENKWLLTKHKNRGLEFPGGKVENGETASDAAIREVMEETGGVISQLTFIGQYKVQGKGRTTIKNIYFARIKELIEQPTYYETDGPILLTSLPNGICNESAYSFIMKDGVLSNSLTYLNEKGLA
jgi:8-oxo-dGTP diphosphatase